MPAIINSQDEAKFFARNQLFVFTDNQGKLKPYPAFGTQAFEDYFTFVWIDQVLCMPNAIDHLKIYYKDNRKIGLIPDSHAVLKIKYLNLTNKLKEFKC